MSQPQRELLAIAELAGHLAENWGRYEHTEALLGSSTISASMGGSRASGHGDPVPTIVATHAHYHGTLEEITEALGHLRNTQRRMGWALTNGPLTREDLDELARAQRASRCSGEIDPTCTRNAVRDGKCWPCYNTVRRAR
jgi:hypothetical protein